MNPIHNNRSHDLRLDEVIDELVAASPEPDRALLAEWVRRYPQYEQELIDFGGNWSLVSRLPAQDEQLPTYEVEGAVAAHMGRVRELMALYSAAPATKQTAETAEAIESLIAEAHARGLTSRDVAERAGLSVPLLTKLDRRLIRYASIPREVVGSIASVLGREASAVAAYLQGSARLAPGASYKADQAPRLPEQTDFADEVRRDRTLTPEQRQRLLSGDQ